MIEIRFVKGNKTLGWYAITPGDRDWDTGISEAEFNILENGLTPPYIENYSTYVALKSDGVNDCK